MKILRSCLCLGAVGMLVSTAVSQSNVHVDRNASDKGFQFEKMPPPATNDAATGATVELIVGDADGSSAKVAVLTDGKLPTSADEPAANFFLQGENGGRLLMDLGRPVEVSRVGTYSWHPDSRAPQVYKLYAATGDEEGFDAKHAAGTDPATVGWTLVADVDSVPHGEDAGGQYGVSVNAVGKVRYLLFDVAKGVPDDPFGNTFYSEIDVVDANGPELIAARVPERVRKDYKSPDGKYVYTVDTTLATDMAEWTESDLLPVIYEWYPKIAEMLPSEGFTESKDVLFEYREDMGGTPAYAAGNRVALNIDFFRGQKQKEGRGAVVHEMVHVVQDYWRARRGNRAAARTPQWVSEGIPDYIRWFLYEPEAMGAEITERNFDRSNFDSSYRVSANFLNWVVENYNKDLIVKLNAICREGKYTSEVWVDLTGKSAEELGAEWKAQNAERLGIKKTGDDSQSAG